ncbi:MAG: GlsB/YeaQ/YmgE family stress response membrane protein [Methylococcaceae bacterium]|nr:GlsB/YeaQ/YmgE family stress response membrane protein [Methylococcaceae bacterium]
MFLSLLIYVAIGAAVGWLVGNMLEGGGYGVVGNIIVGIIGSLVGGFVLGLIGILLPGGLIGSIFTATIGAILFLYAIRFVKHA